MKVKNNNENLITIDSPMVGIIYLTPKPSSPPFAKKGQKIKKGNNFITKYNVRGPATIIKV